MATPWKRALLAGTVLAGGGFAEADAQSRGQDPAIVSELVVTAQRREERLQDVPVSVSALGGEALERAGTKSIEDIARTVPNLVLLGGGSQGSAGQPVIRGISSPVGAATVGVYIDDTPVHVRPSFSGGNVDLQLFDVARVEVLRGPQGTLYGASSMGGTLRYIMASPSFSEWDFRGRAEVAKIGDGDWSYEVAGAGGGPLIEDELALRISASYRHEAGYIDRLSRITGDVIGEDINSRSTLTLRAAAEWRPMDGLSVTPAFLFQHTDRDDLPLYEPALGDLKSRAVILQPGEDRFYLGSLTVDYDLPFATLTSVTSGFNRENQQVTDGSTFLADLLFGQAVIPQFPNYSSESHNALRQQVFTQEVRLASPGAQRLSWIAGAFYSYSRQTSKEFFTDATIEQAAPAIYGISALELFGMPLLPGSGVYNTVVPERDEQAAVFADVTLAVTDRLKVSAGARYSKSRLEYQGFTQGPANGGSTIVEGAQEESPLTPKASISYQARDDLMIYASAQKGFRVGGVNQSVPAARCAADIAQLGGQRPPDAYDADTLWSYEAGVKSQWFDRALTINGGVFHIDWEEIQQRLSLPGCGFGYITNLGTARSRGGEVEIVAQPLEDLTLTASVGYTDSVFTTDILTAPNPKTGARTVIVREGDRVLGIPKTTASFAADYRWDLSPELEAYARADYQYVGTYYRTLPAGRAGFDPVSHKGQHYDVASLRIGVTTRSDLDVSLFVYNVADNRPVVAGSIGLSPISQVLRATTLRPRTIGVTVTRPF
jgi:outer membrane receptor protein involved in Fe transport